MEIVIVADEWEAGELVAGVITSLVNRRPTAVLGVATGSSPVTVYRALGRRYADGEVSFARAQAFLLDEYIGLPEDHPERYRSFVAAEFEARVDFPPGAVQGPDVLADDLRAACDRYEQAIHQAGGVDLQLLGIGVDGHIGFNEPGSSLGSHTRVKTLTDQTRRDNARFFGGDESAVPRHVVTQGIGTILDARHLVMLAFGKAKAPALAAATEGPITAMVPASALQLHPRATVVVDEEAASELRLADYYRETWTHKLPSEGL